eukprot:c31015_g1_i1 orf=134-409(-)
MEVLMETNGHIESAEQRSRQICHSATLCRVLGWVCQRASHAYFKTIRCCGCISLKTSTVKNIGKGYKYDEQSDQFLKKKNSKLLICYESQK